LVTAQKELAAIRAALFRAGSANPQEWPKIVRSIISRIDSVVDRLESAAAQSGSRGSANTAERGSGQFRKAPPTPKTRGGGRLKSEVSQLATINGHSLVCRHVAADVEKELQREFDLAMKKHGRQFEAVVLRTRGGYNVTINISPRKMLRDSRISGTSPVPHFRALLESELREASKIKANVPRRVTTI